VQALYDLLWSYGGFAVFVLAVLVLLLAIAVIWLAARARRLGQRYQALTGGAKDGNLAAMLEDHVRQVQEAAGEAAELDGLVRELHWASRSYMQRVGFLRFNPFRDAGGDQSFAFALTDLDGNGVVLSSLHGRDGNRVYAKPLVGWNSEYPLTDEEQQVIRDAFDPTWRESRD
jgi:hypothetical protein